jgi:hypothetical protein
VLMSLATDERGNMNTNELVRPVVVPTRGDSFIVYGMDGDELSDTVTLDGADAPEVAVNAVWDAIREGTVLYGRWQHSALQPQWSRFNLDHVVRVTCEQFDA